MAGHVSRQIFVSVAEDRFRYSFKRSITEPKLRMGRFRIPSWKLNPFGSQSQPRSMPVDVTTLGIPKRPASRIRSMTAFLKAAPSSPGSKGLRQRISAPILILPSSIAMGLIPRPLGRKPGGLRGICSPAYAKISRRTLQSPPFTARIIY
jgi:hypothetical protein